MDEPPHLLETTDATATWHRSPLSRDMIIQILTNSVGRLEGEPHHVEAVYLTLARLTDLAMAFAINPRRSSSKDALPYQQAFHAMLKAYPAAQKSQQPPPALPIEWIEQMLVWSKALAAHPGPAKGKPVNEFDHFAYPLLMAFYQLVSGSPPAATAGGPTFRFLRHWLTATREAVCAATFSDVEAEERTRHAFHLPTDAALLMKIRSFRKASESELWLPELLWSGFSKHGDGLEASPLSSAVQ